MNSKLGKVLYGLLFCAALPALLILWSAFAPVTMPVGDWQMYGWIGLIIGSLLIIISMLQLWFQGKGLPMNAYPPDKHVATGLYFCFKHPIYVGFCIGCFSLAVILQSSAGFYLIAPVAVLLCWALVKGYEEPELEKRFSLKSNPETDQITWQEKIRVIIPLFVIWTIGYELLVFIGYDSTFINTVLPFEQNFSVIEWAEIPYAFTYVFAFFAPWLIKSNDQLKKFTSSASLIVFIGLFLQWLLPFYAEPRAFTPQTWLGDFIIWERGLDGPAAAFPSFHALWALLAAGTLTLVYPKLKFAWYAVAAIILWSCIAVGAHSILDIVGASVLYITVEYRHAILGFFQRTSERLANSWISWNFNGLRIINHALYSALAAFVGTFIAAQFVQNVWHVLIIVSGTLLGGMFWGQWVEGSSKMLRPFGYFGAILGGIVTVITISLLFNYSIVMLIAAFALASPWTQAIGRLRCLVQGCCHGGETKNSLFGIRYTNEHSRVCAMSGMKGKLLHNTQGYSIIFNVVSGLILFRLWLYGSSPALIAGLYFIFAGATRFVEEQYRGEVQTRIIKGLRLYQWLSIVSILVGIIFTIIPTPETIVFQSNFSWSVWVVSGLMAFLWAFGMSMDFPKSTVRFSRLTG